MKHSHNGKECQDIGTAGFQGDCIAYQRSISIGIDGSGTQVDWRHEMRSAGDQPSTRMHQNQKAADASGVATSTASPLRIKVKPFHSTNNHRKNENVNVGNASSPPKQHHPLTTKKPALTKQDHDGGNRCNGKRTRECGSAAAAAKRRKSAYIPEAQRKVQSLQSVDNLGNEENIGKSPSSHRRLKTLSPLESNSSTKHTSDTSNHQLALSTHLPSVSNRDKDDGHAVEPAVYTSLGQLMDTFNVEKVYVETLKRLQQKKPEYRLPVETLVVKGYQQMLDVSKSTKPQKLLDEVHKRRDEFAAIFNNISRDEGDMEGEPYVTNLGELPKEIAQLLEVLAFWFLHYAPTSCDGYHGRGDKHNMMDRKNGCISMCALGLPNMIANEFSEATGVRLPNNGNAVKTNFSDMYPVTLNKGRYTGAYNKDLNMLVRLLDLNEKKNCQEGRRVLGLIGILGLIQAVTIHRLAKPTSEQTSIIAMGNNPRQALGNNVNNERVKILSTEHPENFCNGPLYFQNSRTYTSDRLEATDRALTEFYLHKLKILHHPLMNDNERSLLENYQVEITRRFGSNELSEYESEFLGTVHGGKFRRLKAFKDSKSNGCCFLYNEDANAVFAIGNNQTTKEFSSIMWGSKKIRRSKFGNFVVSPTVATAAAAFDDGLEFQNRLNEKLEELANLEVEARIEKLINEKNLGVESYTEPIYRKERERFAAYNISGSDGCFFLYNEDFNVVHAIGNKQTTKRLKSIKWGSKQIRRSRFGEFVVSPAVATATAAFDDGLEMEARLNEKLEELANLEVEARIEKLINEKNLGVESYTEPIYRKEHMRFAAYESSRSDGCFFLYNEDFNVVHAIGNKQTTKQLKSIKWNKKEIRRSRFGEFVVSPAVATATATFDDGLEMEARLNEKLEELANLEVEARIEKLINEKDLGVESYTEPIYRKEHMRFAAYESSRSDGCFFLYNEDFNVVHAIGNKQTTKQLKSIKWNKKEIWRTRFGEFVVSPAVATATATFDDGLEMEARLNERLEELANLNVEARIQELINSDLGVESYTEPTYTGTGRKELQPEEAQRAFMYHQQKLEERRYMPQMNPQQQLRGTQSHMAWPYPSWPYPVQSWTHPQQAEAESIQRQARAHQTKTHHRKAAGFVKEKRR